MSIIERAAELLRSEPPSQQSRPATIKKGELRRHGLIERAAAEFAEAHYLPADAKVPLESEKTTAPNASPSAAPRQFAVDRNHLRTLRLLTPEDERTPLAESFRRIKRQILANIDTPTPGAPPANLVLVTSAVAGEGKTFCAINLALSMALERDRTVLLVDTD